MEFEFKWKRAGTPIDVPITEYLGDLLKTELDKGYMLKVAVGTDSQRHGKQFKFATVILIMVKEDMGGGVVKGHGGKMIDAVHFHGFKAKRKDGVNERMLYEVGKSIEAAYIIAPVLIQYGVSLEIHADINPDPRWESNKALSQAIGYILGMGYEFKIKPDAWGASFGADRYAK